MGNKETIKKMNIVFIPDKSNNPYIKNTIACLKSSRNTVYSKKEIKKASVFLAVKIIHFNWIENLDTSSVVRHYFSFLKKTCILLFLKIFRKKIIWTMHNKISHKHKNHLLDLLMMKICIVLSNKIIIHSNMSKQILAVYHKNINGCKIFYIPHGNYLPDIKYYNIKNPDNKIVFLFFGLIKPYKNIEILIEIFNNQDTFTGINYELMITGTSVSNEYISRLNHLIKKNIKLQHEFLSDDALNDLIQKSDIVVLPFDITSSLNSGSIMLSFSNKRTVISPSIGTLDDINKDFYYSYDYTNQEEHKTALTHIILKAVNDYKNNNNIFNKKGEEAYLYVKKHNNWDLIKKKMLDVYND